MKNLIPHFIQRHYERDHFDGHFNAAALAVDFVDIDPPLLQKIYPSLVTYIYGYGGLIWHYVDTGLLAFYPIRRKDPHLYAIQTAFYIQQWLDDNHPTTGVKMGLAMGQADWGIVGTEILSYYVRGEVVDDCLKAKSLAEKNQIIASKSIMSHVKDGVVYDQLDQAYNQLQETTLELPAKDIRLSSIKKKVANRFLPDEIITFRGKAHDAEICPLFIALNTSELNESSQQLITSALLLMKEYGGLINRIHFEKDEIILSVLFGAPPLIEQKMRRAVEFLVALKSTSQDLAIEWRAGLTEGMVYTGFIGGEERTDYIAIGPQVIKANQLMAQAKWGEIHVSKEIYVEMGNHYDFIILDDGETIPPASKTEKEDEEEKPPAKEKKHRHSSTKDDEHDAVSTFFVIFFLLMFLAWIFKPKNK